MNLTYATFQGGRWLRLPGDPTCTVCHGEGGGPPNDAAPTGWVCDACDGSGRREFSDAEWAEAEALAEQAAREAWAWREEAA